MGWTYAIILFESGSISVLYSGLVHIYDVGFQSPNVEAARPLVYATALLLVSIIVALNITAVTIRNRLREKYRMLEH